MIAWRSEEWTLARFLECTLADFNPKDADPDEIVKLAEDYRVFGIGRSFAVREDGLLLDGHQSLYALGRLSRGEHLVKGVPALWTPPAKVSLRVASGMSDTVARAFVAAVNARRVETDPKKYGALLADLTERVKGASDDDRAFYAQAVDAIGLGADELASYLGAASPEHAGGARSKGNPKATFEFSAPAIRDQVKQLVADAGEELPSGDALAKLLGVKLPKKARA